MFALMVVGFEGIAISRFFLEIISDIFVISNFCPKVAFMVIFGKSLFIFMLHQLCSLENRLRVRFGHAKTIVESVSFGSVFKTLQFENVKNLCF